jgi:hypothetical protein
VAASSARAHQLREPSDRRTRHSLAARNIAYGDVALPTREVCGTTPRVRQSVLSSERDSTAPAIDFLHVCMTARAHENWKLSAVTNHGADPRHTRLRWRRRFPQSAPWPPEAEPGIPSRGSEAFRVTGCAPRSMAGREMLEVSMHIIGRNVVAVVSSQRSLFSGCECSSAQRCDHSAMAKAVSG